MISEDPLFTDIVRRASLAEQRVDQLTDLVLYMAMGIERERMPAHLQALLNGIINE